MANRAENNAEFIFAALERLQNNMGAARFDYVHGVTNLPDIPNNRGIYVFYADFGANGRYPVYVGKSEQGFRTRFARHANDGVIWRFQNNEFPRFPFVGNPQLRAILLTIPLGFTSKLAESLFLYPFDFALNTMENNQVRLVIDVINANPVEVSYTNYFRIMLDTMIQQTQQLDNALRI